MLKSWSFRSFLLVVIAISTLSVAHYMKGPIRVIDYDVSGYYAYLPAIFIYDDLKDLNWRPEIIKKYNFNGLDDCTPERESGATVIKYPVGMAISYLPGFTAAHLSLTPRQTDTVYHITLD